MQSVVDRNVVIRRIPVIFYRLSENCEKRLLLPSRLSIRLGTNRLPLDGFSCNLISEHFSKICRENSSSLNSDNNTRFMTCTSVCIREPRRRGSTAPQTKGSRVWFIWISTLTGIFHLPNPSGCTVALGSTKHLTEKSTMLISAG